MLDHFQRTQQARHQFFSGDAVGAQVVSDRVLRSWERSRRLGLGASDRVLFDLADPAARSSAQERNRRLIRYALPGMTKLHRALRANEWLLACLDPTGFVIQSVGEPDGPCRKLAQLFRRGVSLSENAIGTNAPGCALVEQVPTVVNANEHFLDEIQAFSCAAVPLFDVDGSPLGALNATCYGGGDQSEGNLLAVCEALQVTARTIEQQMLLDLPGAVHVSVHYHPGLLPTPLAGVLAFSRDGHLLGGNHAARTLLGYPWPSPCAFDHIFDHSFPAMLDRLAGNQADPIMTDTPAGIRLHMSLTTLSTGGQRRPTRGAAGETSRGCLAPPALASGMICSDAVLLDALADVKLAFARDIPVLLNGETGTGKEVFAREIHASGPRRNGPFIAVNCASIPEGLIEADLFGYVDGAFTGARRGGAMGKFEQAHGGTLFLDEIGDMPLALQGRLLRVLQERKVTRVGGAKDQPIDISLVCATHHDLGKLIAQGQFREDLFYRIDGLSITLPPLRERSDFGELVDDLLRREAGMDEAPQLADAAYDCLRAYAWPGNIRQLDHVVRRAVALVGAGDRIEPRHLPEEMRRTCAPPTGESETSLGHVERAAIVHALGQHRGNITAAARMLGISRPTLYRKLRVYVIERRGTSTSPTSVARRG